MPLRLAAAALAAGALLAAQPAAAAADADATQLRAGTLTINGTDAADTIALTARPDSLELDLGDDGTVDAEVPRRGVHRIRIAAGGGDDRVRIDDGPLALLRFTPITVDGGDGYDVVTASAGRQVDVHRAGAGAVLDRHAFGSGIRLDASEEVLALTGDGADEVRVGDLGEALLQVSVGLATDGRSDRITVAGSAATDFTDVLGFGDTVYVLGPTFVELLGAEPQDELIVDGDEGDDRMNVSTGEGMVHTTLRGGPGGDHFLGGAAADRFEGGGGVDVVEGRRGDDDVQLGAGNDIAIWSAGDGADALDGRGGRDALTMWGGPAAEAFALEPGRMTADGQVIGLEAMERVETVAQNGADTYHLADLSGTPVDEVVVSLSGVPATPRTDGLPDRVTVDGTADDDALAIAGDAGRALVTGLPFRFAIERTEPADSLAIDGGGGTDTLDTSGLLPGAIAATLAD
jgi:Ca2+-binding RTX toxin-like protein